MPSAKDPVATVQPGPGHAPPGSVTATSLNFTPSTSGAPITAHITDPIGAHQASAIAAGPYGDSDPWRTPAGSVDSALQEVFEGLNDIDSQIDAHIVDAVGAHHASAIATNAYGGSQRWSIAAGNADAVFTKVFEGLNAGASSTSIVLLDATAGTPDADYSGPNALINAVAAKGTKAIFYMRPGQYNWNNSTVLDGTVIIGVGSPATAAYVEIVATANHMRFSNGASVRNVLLTTVTSGSVYLIESATGGCTFENVHFKLAGRDLFIGSTRNVLRQCARHSSSTDGVRLVESGGGNLYESCSFDQVLVTTSGSYGGGCVFRSLKIGGENMPLTTNPLLVTSNSNVFDVVQISHSGEIAVSELKVTGSYNVFRNVSIDGFDTRTYVVFVDSGVDCAFQNLQIANGECCTNDSNGAVIYGNTSATVTVVESLRITGCTVGGTTNSLVAFYGGHCVVQGAVITNTTGFYRGVYIPAQRCVVERISIRSAPTLCFVEFGPNSRANVLRNSRFGNMTLPSSATAFFKIGGSENVAEGIEVLSVAGLQNERMIHFSSAVRCCVRGVRVVDAAVVTPLPAPTEYSELRFVYFEASTHCMAQNLELRDSPGFTTAYAVSFAHGLVQFNGATGCVLDGLSISGVGSNVTSSSGQLGVLLNGFYAVSTQCVVRNVAVVSSITGTRTLLEIDHALFNGLALDNINLTVSHPANLLSIGGSADATVPRAPLRFARCIFNNTFAEGAVMFPYSLHISGSPRYAFEDCYFSAASGDAVAVIEGSTTYCSTFSDCVFEASGVNPPQTVSAVAGVKFERCVFYGSNTSGTGTVGVPLFSGAGVVTSNQSMPLILEDCKMLLGNRNFDAIGDMPLPMVFFGGFGDNPITNHGAIIVRGLVIQRRPSASVTAWHRGQTLCIDTVNQSGTVASDYQDITIEVGLRFDRAMWNDSGVITTLNPLGDLHGAMVEINGPDSGSRSARIRGLRVMRLTQTGGKNPSSSDAALRGIILACGVSLQDITIDGIAGDVSESQMYGQPALMVSQCDVDGVDLFPTASIPIGGYALFGEGSTLRNVRSSKAGSSGAGVIALLYSTLRESKIVVPTEIRPVHVIDAIASVVADNIVECDYHSGAATDVLTIVYAGSNYDGNVLVPAVVSGNTFINRAFHTANAAFNVQAPSRGGSIDVVIEGNDARACNNMFQYTCNTGSVFVPTIRRGGTGGRLKIVGNSIFNAADSNLAYSPPIANQGGGTAGITVGGGAWHDVSHNTVYVDNKVTGAAFVDMTGADRYIVLGNVVHCVGQMQNGAVSSGSNQKPATAGDFNSLT